MGDHSKVTTQMKPDVLSAIHFITETWRLITHTTIKNCFVKCSFLIDNVSSNDDTAVKLTEGVWSVNKVLDQQPNRPEEEPEDKEKLQNIEQYSWMH
jgi:hypothetical protein